MEPRTRTRPRAPTAETKMSTAYTSTKEALADRKWWIIDAAGLTLGRVSAMAARVLMGKNKPTWTPSTDCGDFVVIVNCEKARLTGRKPQQKIYRHYTGYPGGLKEIAAEKLQRENPVHAMELAIQGMLPKTRLGRAMARKLKVHAGPNHPHAAQAPQPLDLGLARRAERP